MIDPDIIRGRLDYMNENLQPLHELKGMPFQEFASDYWKNSTAKYAVQTSIEAVIDICKYLVARLQAGMPESHTDLPIILCKQGVFSNEFAERLSAMIRMRNVLVHGYVRVNLEKVHQVVQESLGDFDEFARYIVEYLEREGIA